MKIKNHKELTGSTASPQKTLTKTDNYETRKNNSLLILSAIFSALLILSNLTSSKISQFAGLTTNSVIIFFPITYLVSDIITEVYGFKASRRVIWCGFFANLVIVIGLKIILLMPHIDLWPHQQAYETVFGVSGRIFVASMISYLIGEFVNSYIMAKMKIASKGKYLWLRSLTSSIAGELIDSFFFTMIAFLFVFPLPILFTIMFSQYFLKIIVEIIVLPVTYRVISYLKKKDKEDYYDHNTKFSIFGL